MPSLCASIFTISWQRKRRPKRRKLPQLKPNPHPRARWPPLQPPQNLPRFRKLLRRRKQVPRPNRPPLRPLLRYRELSRRVHLPSPRLLFMRLRLPHIPLRILLRLQNPALLLLLPLRHPRLRQGPVPRLLNGPPRPQDPQALRDNRARHIPSGPPPHLLGSVRQVLAHLRPHSDIQRAPAVLPEQDKGVPGFHRVTAPAAVRAARRVPAVRSVPVGLHPDFRNVPGIAPIKVLSAASVLAREFPRRSRASRCMHASRPRADVR